MKTPEPNVLDGAYADALAAWAKSDRKSGRAKSRPDGISTRCDRQFMSDAELAISAAMAEVEKAGASTALTDAVMLLSKARDRVADHVETEA